LKFRVLFATAAALLAVAAFFLWTGGAPGDTPPMAKVVLATSNEMLSTLIFVAQREGYFKREGLAVDIVWTPTGKDAFVMVQAGRTDFAAVATYPLTLAILNGARPHIIATIAKSDHAFDIVTTTGSGIRQISDLRGKTVAARRNTGFEFFLDTALIDAGVSPSEIAVSDLSPDAALAALEHGTVNAAVLPSPINGGMLQQAGGTVVVRARPSYTAHWNIVASDGLVKARPAIAARLLRALIDADTLADRNAEQAMKDAAAPLHIAQQYVLAHWPEYMFRVQLPQSLIVAMEDETRWINVGRNSKSPAMPTPNFLDYLDVEALSKVKPDAIRITR
jgi:NitT/TauT family transport system substrate-binding protein